MRNSAKIIFFIVLVTFLGFMAYGGVVSIISGRTAARGGGQSAPPGVIGIVNGQDISTFLFEEQYRAKLANLSTDEHEPTEIEMEQARTEVWNNITTLALVEQEAQKHTITVNDQEVADYMRNSPPRDLIDQPSFQTEGKFDIGKYQIWLQQMALSPDVRHRELLNDLESQIRNQLLLARMQDVVLSTIKITEADAKRDWIEKNEKAKVRYFFIPAGEFDSTITSVPEAELLARFEKDREQYKQPEMMVIDYALIPKTTGPDDSASVKEEIDRIYSELISGVDFAELATAFSQDPGSAKNGGDLGWFGEGKMVEQFWKATTSLKNVGDISAPFTSQFGWHIIKLTGKRSAKDDKGVEKPEYQASHILIKMEPSPETLAKLEQKSNNFRLDAEKLGFGEAAKEYGITVTESKPFVKGNQVPGIGANQALNDFAFAGKPGEITDVISGRNGFYVCKINRRIPAGITPFADVKPRIETQVLREKRVELAHQRGDQLALEFEKGKSFDEVAGLSGKPIFETDFVNRSQFIPKIGSDPDFVGAAFKLSPSNPVSRVVKSKTGAYIIQYVDRLMADSSVFVAASDSLVNGMIESKRKDSWSKWLSSIKQKAKIEDYRNVYYGS
jgi:parvulin-like peptidyl-prolyl isomerase